MFSRRNDSIRRGAGSRGGARPLADAVLTKYLDSTDPMSILRLKTLDAFIAFDLDGCEVSAGGTRLAADVTEHEAELLARAMTYKFAVLGLRMGGAKGAI